MTGKLTDDGLTRERRIQAAEAIKRHLANRHCPDEDLLELVEMEVKELLGRAALNSRGG